MEMALRMARNFDNSLAKELKTIVRKFGGLIPMFAEVTEEKFSNKAFQFFRFSRLFFPCFLVRYYFFATFGST